MHILIVSCGYPNDYQPLEGIFYRDQAEALATNGYKVGVVATVAVSLKDIIRTKRLRLGKKHFTGNGVPTFLKLHISIPGRPDISVRKCKTYGLKLFHDYIALHGKPDIVHLHCFEGGELALAIKQQYGIPFVITEHSSRFLLGTVPASMEAFASATFKQASCCIAVSEHLKNVLEKRYNIPFYYVPNIVEQGVIFRDSSIAKKGMFTFFHAAGMNINKNQAMLLRAFRKAIDEGMDADLDMAGDGPLRQELGQLADELGIAERVRFLGYLSRSELQYHYNASHCFVLSSYQETFGVVIIEALSCGLPCVATRCGGPESILTEPWLGELTEISEDALSLGLLNVFRTATGSNAVNSDRYDARKISDHAKSHYSGAAVAKKLGNIYKEIST